MLTRDISFNGVLASSFGLNCNFNNLNVLPSIRSSKEYVLGRDGGYDFTDGYNDIDISIDFDLINPSQVDRQKKMNEISKWLAGNGKLIFGNEQDVYYEARVLTPVETFRRSFLNQFTVVFSCKPVKYQNYGQNPSWEEAEAYWDYADFPWSGEEVSFDITESTTVILNNNGNYKTYPLIKLTGTATNIIIEDITYENLSDETVYIDCLNKLVYSISGESKINKATNSDITEFIELSVGENELNISGTGLDLNVEFDFRNAYIA